MTLKNQLQGDLKEAMRAKDVARRSTLRLLRAAIKNAEIEVGHPLEDEEVLEVINKEAKRRREAITEYKQAGRQDLVEQEQAELAIIETYLPRQMNREEIETVVHKVIADLNAQSLADLGKVMGRLMPELKGQADGRLVHQIVRDILSENHLG
jgi:uncharacterized protein